MERNSKEAEDQFMSMAAAHKAARKCSCDDSSRTPMRGPWPEFTDAKPNPKGNHHGARDGVPHRVMTSLANCHDQALIFAENIARVFLLAVLAVIATPIPL